MGAWGGGLHGHGQLTPGTASNGRLRKMNDDDRHEKRRRQWHLKHKSMANPPGDGGRGNDGRTDGTEGPNTGVVVKARPKTRKPAMYKVLMLNDDYTPMEFVVHVLERFFQKSREEATRIMLHVHRRGVGVCGVFTYEVAETKVTQVMDLARQNQHPLQCTIEKE
jgi:ATP-dependent Clp protease adaptor protein ClpS